MFDITMAFTFAVILSGNSTPKLERRVALCSLRLDARAETPKPEHSELDMMDTLIRSG